jgi:hypothetical protein
MKTNKSFLFLTVLALAAACNKDNDSEPANSITTDEAAVIVSSSLASNTSGFSSVSSKTSDVTEGLLADNAGGRVDACGVSQNVAFSGSSPANATITYSYDFSYKFRLVCNDDNTPKEVSVDISFSGDFDGPKLKASHSGVSELDVTALADTTKSYLLNGLYKRSGSFENKEQETSGNSSIEITLADLVVNKKTHKIVSGKGTYTITGNVPDKGDFKYTGDITFEGNDAAILDVHGDKFDIDLKEGNVNKKHS